VTGEAAADDTPRVLRLYDPDRRPASWTEIVRGGQFVAFARFLDGGGSCDADGRPFASDDEITCLLFDDFAAARRFCERQVQQFPMLAFDILDSTGRLQPPVLVVVHPSRAAVLDGNPRQASIRKRVAAALAAGALPLFWFDYASSGRLILLPTIVGINMIVAAARLLQLNAGHADAERRRLARLEHIESAGRIAPQP
jgi:hypothetical protein